MKVVFDTNVLVSAFISEGVCAKLLGRARRGQSQLIICPFILKEFEQVLLKRVSATKGETRQALRVLTEAVSIISPPAQAVSGICRELTLLKSPSIMILRKSRHLSRISWKPAVFALVSLSGNCARSSSQCAPNAHDQPLDGPPRPGLGVVG